MDERRDVGRCVGCVDEEKELFVSPGLLNKARRPVLGVLDYSAIQPHCTNYRLPLIVGNHVPLYNISQHGNMETLLSDQESTFLQYIVHY